MARSLARLGWVAETMLGLLGLLCLRKLRLVCSLGLVCEDYALPARPLDSLSSHGPCLICLLCLIYFVCLICEDCATLARKARFSFGLVWLGKLAH